SCSEHGLLRTILNKRLFIKSIGMNKKYFIQALLVLLINIPSPAQNTFSKSDIEVGKPLPKVVFNDVLFYKTKKVSSDEFKGKWLFLDFWSKDCSGCISRFPRTRDEQDKYKDKIQFLMVTYNDPENQHKPLYEKYHDKLKLSMPCAFIDSNMMDNQFN